MDEEKVIADSFLMLELEQKRPVQAFIEIGPIKYVALNTDNAMHDIRVDPSWEWIGLKVEGEVEREVEGYSYFCLKCSLYGCDLLDNRIGRLHTNFQVSATLSKKSELFY